MAGRRKYTLSDVGKVRGKKGLHSEAALPGLSLYQNLPCENSAVPLTRSSALK